MLKEFVEKIVEISAPNLITGGGREFSDKPLHMIPYGDDYLLSNLHTNTLTSILDYITHGTDRPTQANQDLRYIIHVEAYNSVQLMREANAMRKREDIIEASSANGSFRYGQFMDVETFIISLQSNFEMTENLAALLSAVSSISDGTEVQLKDDGITQAVTAKTGVALVAKKDLPNPITLKPYRTFPEIEQPNIKFVFRVRKDRAGGVEAALFDADGDHWKIETIQTIHTYFAQMLPDEAMEKTIILA